MNELALFAGAGGGILGGQLLGWRTVCAVENDEYARSVLLARQNDGRFEPFPVWDDVRTFDGRPWRGVVDVVSGGFPCQDISAAGKGEGISGSRSGLWHEMARTIREVQPAIVFAENSPMLTSRGLDVVLGDLSALGFDEVEWGVLGAHHAGAPHKRDRIWILAAHPDRYPLRNKPGRGGRPNGESAAKPECDGAPQPMANADSGRRERKRQPQHGNEQGACRHQLDRRSAGRRGEGAALANASEGRRRHTASGSLDKTPAFAGESERARWWEAEPAVGRVVDGLAASAYRHRAARLRAIGNGQVPHCMALAYRVLEQRMNER